MSIDRLKEYAKPLRKENWQGAGRDQSNLDRWSQRATEESKIAPRASGGEMKLPSTGKQPALRDTSMSPRTSRKVDAAMCGKDDLNVVGSSPFMRDVRRTT
jgi:hypothetical protein